jgi:hypothetical protein
MGCKMKWLNKAKDCLGLTQHSNKKNKADNIARTKISSIDFGLRTQEVLDVFCMLINKFLSPTLRIESIEQFPMTEEMHSRETSLVSSEAYKHLEEFVKQHSINYSKEDIYSLNSCLQKDGHSFNEEELKNLINLENTKQQYSIFKQIMLSTSPADFKEYLRRFATVYGKQIKLLDDWRIVKLIASKNLTNEELKQELEKEYIYKETLNDILPTDETNSLPRLRAIGKKAMLVCFFNKLLVEKKVQHEPLQMGSLIDLIITETGNLQSEDDNLYKDMIKVLDPALDFTNRTIRTFDLHKELYEKIKLSNLYHYLINFVKKYNLNYTDDDFNNLASLFKSKKVNLNRNELESIIGTENDYQLYLRFKKPFEGIETDSLKHVLKRFAATYNKELKDLKFYFDIIKEHKFAKREDGDWYINYEFKDLEGKPYYMGYNRLSDVHMQNYINIRSLKDFIYENRVPLIMDDKLISIKELIEYIFYIRQANELENFEQTLQKGSYCSIDDVDSFSGYEFESFLKKLFISMGYLVKQTKLSGDQGADLVVEKLGEKTVVQAKRCNTPIGNSAVQEVVASIAHYKADKGMVVTNNEFTTSAVQLASSNKIDLIDRKELMKLIKEFL